MKNNIIIFGLLTFVFISPYAIFAQSPTNPGTGGTGGTPATTNLINASIDNPFNCSAGGVSTKDCTLLTLINAILRNIIMPIASVAIVVWIVWAGFQFVLAQGKPADIQKAQANLLWSLVGAGLLLGAYGISAVVQATVTALIK